LLVTGARPRELTELLSWGTLRRVVHAFESVERESRFHDALAEIAGRHGADASRVKYSLRVDALDHGLGLIADEPLSRRQRQRRRRAVAAASATPHPSGRGRRPGAKGKDALQRREELMARLRDLPPEEQYELLLTPGVGGGFVAVHEARWNVSRATAFRDWHMVTREAAGTVGYLTPLAHAVESGDKAGITRERRRVRQLERRILGIVSWVRTPPDARSLNLETASHARCIRARRIVPHSRTCFARCRRRAVRMGSGNEQRTRCGTGATHATPARRFRSARGCRGGLGARVTLPCLTED
jgi:hypothetical protein